MNALEIGKLAGRARHGEAAALQEFIGLAKREGWRGRGGWLYLNGGCEFIHGWKALAEHVYFGVVRLTSVETGPGG